MKEPVFITWGILLFAVLVLVRFCFKRYGRTMGRYGAYLKIGLALIALGISLLLFWALPAQSAHLVWSVRLAVVTLAVADVWIAYQLPFTHRDRLVYEEDSFIPEGVFFLSHALAVSMIFVAGPQVLGLVDQEAVDVSGDHWDLPLLFLIPFLAVKMADFSGQIPYREVENRWVYPLEFLEPPKNNEQGMVRMEFELCNGVRKEYHPWAKPEQPWVLLPRQIPLGDMFRITMQERKNRSDLHPIDDIGDEHGGAPLFWWLFTRKVRWHPGTWFTKPRHLNPSHSYDANNLHAYDVVVLRRVPVTEGFSSGLRMASPANEEDTIII